MLLLPFHFQEQTPSNSPPYKNLWRTFTFTATGKHMQNHSPIAYPRKQNKAQKAPPEMAFSKSKFLALFLLFCSLHLGFADEEVVNDPNVQSEIIGYRLPYSQDCCCSGGGGGNYCNPPCGQNGCGCVQNPGNRCSGGPVCQPCNGGSVCQPCNAGPPPCQWQGPCPSCGCARSSAKFGTQSEPDHPTSEPMPAKNEGN